MFPHASFGLSFFPSSFLSFFLSSSFFCSMCSPVLTAITAFLPRSGRRKVARPRGAIEARAKGGRSRCSEKFAPAHTWKWPDGTDSSCLMELLIWRC